MDQISYPSQIGLSEFSNDNKNPRNFYGLPKEVLYCKKCVISNQRTNSAVEYKHSSKNEKKTIHFDIEEICDACRYSEKKFMQIDWDARDKELKELCHKYRLTDCQMIGLCQFHSQKSGLRRLKIMRRFCNV